MIALNKNPEQIFHIYKKLWVKYALAGNRTRAPHVAGEDSTTEPPMLCWYNTDLL